MRERGHTGYVAPGTLRDWNEAVDLERDVPFFASARDAEMFLRLALSTILTMLPLKVNYADFGGGQGLVASLMVDLLRSRGHEVDAVVVDANPNYLERAAARGLRVRERDLTSTGLRGLNLVSMRLVNHYNPLSVQTEILAEAQRALEPEGYFVAQIETGSAAGCGLRTEIANMPELAAARTKGCRWVALEDFECMLALAGFVEVRLVGFSLSSGEPLDVVLSDAWHRYHGNPGDSQTVERRRRFLDAALNRVTAWHDAHGDDRLGVFRRGEYLEVRRQHAVVVARRPAP